MDEVQRTRRDLILGQIGAERYLRRLAWGVKSPEDRSLVPMSGVSLRGRREWEAPLEGITQVAKKAPARGGFEPLPIDSFIVASRGH